MSLMLLQLLLLAIAFGLFCAAAYAPVVYPKLISAGLALATLAEILARWGAKIG